MERNIATRIPANEQFPNQRQLCLRREQFALQHLQAHKDARFFGSFSGICVYSRRNGFFTFCQYCHGCGNSQHRNCGHADYREVWAVIRGIFRVPGGLRHRNTAIVNDISSLHLAGSDCLR